MSAGGRGRPAESIQRALGIARIGAGYVLRTDGTAVGLIELTPPDLRLYDAAAQTQLLVQYAGVLRSVGERCMIQTYATPADLRPLLHAMQTARDAAPDPTSYAILAALLGTAHNLLQTAANMPQVRWILSVVSDAPEAPPRGTWGELDPAHVRGTRVPSTSADPVADVLRSARRIASALGALGLEPPPTVMDADATWQLIAYTLDPVRVSAHATTPQLNQTRPFVTTQEGAA